MELLLVSDSVKLSLWKDVSTPLSQMLSLSRSSSICCLVEDGDGGSEHASEAIFPGPKGVVPEVEKAAWITSMASV